MGEYAGEHSEFKADRRQAKKDKARDRMDQGKKLKLLDRMILRRAKAAEARLAEMDKKVRQRNGERG